LVGLPALALVLYWREAAADHALPEYTLETPGLKEPVSFLVGGQVTVRLRPAVAVTTPVAVSAYWERDREAKPWKTSTTVSKDGTVEMIGTVDAPFGGVEANLLFIVSRVGAGASPAPANCLPPGCRVVRRTVRLVRPIVPAGLPR
jgi:hypothetical protein